MGKLKHLRRRVSRKNQVAIPKVFLQRYLIMPQGEVIFEEHKDGLLLKPAEDSIKQARGMLKGIGKTSQQIKDEIRQEELAFEKRKFSRFGIHL